MELIGYLIIVIYLFLIAYFSKDLLTFVQEQKLRKRLLFYFSLLFPGFVLLYILQGDNFIYYADQSNYWIKSIRYDQFIDERGLSTFGEIYNSIKHDHYNDFIVLPTTLLERVLGFEFRYYVFCMYLIYAIPSALLFTNLLMIISEKKKEVFLLIPILILSFVPLILPMRMGFSDIACLVPIGLILNIFFKSKFSEKVEFKKFAVIGILLLFLIISRRYFTFWFVNFFLVNFLIIAFWSIAEKKFSILKFGTINLGIAGLTSIAVMLIFFYPFFELTFLTDYKDIYSGYRERNWNEHFISLLYRFGYVFLLLPLLGAFAYFSAKKYYFASFSLISVFAIFFYFVSYNDFGPQHYYLIIPFIILLIFGNIFLLEGKYNKFIIGAIAILFGVNFYLSVMSNKSVKNSSSFFIKSPGYKLVRSDYNELAKIVNDIKSNYEQGYFTYNLANSEVLHTSILQNFDLPKSIISTPGILNSQHVDKRDEFPNDLFKAKYVLTATPVQLHLAPKDQQLIVFFNEGLLDGQFKEHYEKVKTYNLDNNKVEITLLKKVKGFSLQEIETIKNHFETLYPDYPKMYDVNVIAPLTESVKLGMGGKVNFNGNNIQMDPGSEDSTEVVFDLDSLATYKFNFTAGFRSKDYILNNCDLENEAEVNFNVYINDTIFDHRYLTYKKDTVYNFETINASKIKFQVDKGKNKNWCDLFQLSDFEITKE